MPQVRTNLVAYKDYDQGPRQSQATIATSILNIIIWTRSSAADHLSLSQIRILYLMVVQATNTHGKVKITRRQVANTAVHGTRSSIYVCMCSV